MQMFNPHLSAKLTPSPDLRGKDLAQVNASCVDLIGHASSKFGSCADGREGEPLPYDYNRIIFA